MKEMPKNHRKFIHIALRSCPIIALIFSILVTITTLYINQGLSLPFIFMSVQVYLNWYSIYSISYQATTMKCNNIGKESNNKYKSTVILMNGKQQLNECQEQPRLKYWYCEKCFTYTYRPTQHCSFCKKCFHFKDHHCFFIGACIIQQNMGNFILICLHTFLACVYSLSVIGPYLYDNFDNILNKNSSVIDVVMYFCFPVAFARFLLDENSCLLLVTLFDIICSVILLCFGFAVWKLYSCLSGKQKYFGQIARKQEIKEIFGSYGLSNVLFPYNGLIGTRDIGGKYELKEI